MLTNQGSLYFLQHAQILIMSYLLSSATINTLISWVYNKQILCKQFLKLQLIRRHHKIFIKYMVLTFVDFEALFRILQEQNLNTVVSHRD